MMRPDTKFRYWLTCAIAAGWQMEEGDYTRPAFVGGAETAENLDSLSFGQLIELSRLSATNDLFYDVCRIVLKIDRETVNQARAVDVVTFVGWVTAEVNKINERFKKLSTKPTDTERKAGIERLNFGLFGLMDRYARRMHITNHDDVLSVPWIRVYRCIEMDNEADNYQKRYMEVMENDYRRKNRGHRGK